MAARSPRGHPLRRGGEITYYHIELNDHDVILAENPPAESYLDLGNRAAFHNGGPAVDLHPDFASRVWSEKACTELILGGLVLTALRQRLALQSALRGRGRQANAPRRARCFVIQAR